MKSSPKKLLILCLIVSLVATLTFFLTACDSNQPASETTLDPNKPIGTLETTSDSVSETTTVIETTTATQGSTYPPATVPNITTNQTYASVTTAGTTTETTPAPTTTKYYPVYTTRYPLYPVFTTTRATTIATTTVVTTTETTTEETTTAETTTKNEIDLPWDNFGLRRPSLDFLSALENAENK